MRKQNVSKLTVLKISNANRAVVISKEQMTKLKGGSIVEEDAVGI